MMTQRGTNRISTILLTVLLTVIATSTATAGDDAGMRSVFATGAGNRALAMGGAFAAVADDASAPIWNPAGLGLVARKELQASQTTLFGMGFQEQYGSFVLPSHRWGAASLTWRRFGVDGIEERDQRGFLTSDNLEDSESELALGYGRSFLAGDLTVGGAFKIQHQSLAGYSGSGLGLDLGLWSRPLALVGVDGNVGRRLALGVAVRNAVEPKIKLDQDEVPDPTALRAGLAWTQDLAQQIQLVAAVDLEKTRYMDRRLHLGAECRLYDVLALRAGSFDGSLTAGAGLAWHGVGADYQYEDNHLGDIHRFGVTLHFGPTVDESRRAATAAAEAALQSRLEAAFTERSRNRETNLLASIRTALDAEQWDDALTLTGTLAVLAPDHASLPPLTAEAWRGLARQQVIDGDLTAAALSLRKVLAATPDDAEARAALDRVQLESDRSSARSRELRARFEAALDAFAREDLLTARDGFATILELAPNDQEAVVMLARIEAAMTRRATSMADEAVTLAQADQLDIARERLEAAQNLDQQAPGVAAAVAEIARGAQPTTTGRGATRAVRRPVVGPEATITPERRRELAELYRHGLEAMEAGHRAEAVHYWEMVWDADPDFEQVGDYLNQEYLAQGMEAYAGGGLREAVTSWEHALRVAPDDPRARGYLERAHQQLSRMEKISTRR